ncbi:MAG: membrane lipoprotein lipid attachment site-containing protein [bacterium]|nr:membrane lipoprotein lipid attachment site-containing protein [bacterium]
MKKFLIILGMLVVLSGCTKIEDKNYDEIINTVITSKYEIQNTYRTGYKYYAPTNIGIINKLDYNETLADEFFTYYFYIDVVSYYNRVIENYEENSNAVYSKTINYEDKYGYIEINKWRNDKYLLEIMYNYAKIEVIVNEAGIKNAIATAMVVLTSVKYNNNVLDNIIGENVLTSKEIDFNIFETKKSESNFLQVSENDIYEGEDTIKDPDLVK